MREVVERVLGPEQLAPVRLPPPLAAAPIGDDAASRVLPQRAREWAQLLDQLVDQLADESSPVAREHWHHLRLHDQLGRVQALLAAAHPGGLGRLYRRR